MAGDAATGTSDTLRFVLSRPSGTVEGYGVRARFTDRGAAADAVRSGAGVVGALAFDPDGPCDLTSPQRRVVTGTPWARDVGPAAPVEVTESDPARHAERVRRALKLIAAGELEKVVLARHVTVTSAAAIDPVAVLSRLTAADPGGNGYLVRLGDPDEPSPAVLVGSSPEVLVRRTGTTVSCHPLAGSAPRTPGDDTAGRALLASGKDRHEHALVVEALRRGLTPLCSELDVPAEPTLVATGQMWHLGTPIVGRIADPATTALDLAIAVHPTPAVCGSPYERAFDLIRREEPDRGLYTGAVGWCDEHGDGEWMVAIRCALVDGSRTSATAYAGGGIVDGSDPDAEVDETRAKLRTVLGALGG
ncbi:isochorismate synthase [Rhodococcus rhodnii]|uniref:isochorismate synthase n=2 Tax=Rhodococcus rhodnii TaxID=38312 RepID=R7WNV8_9NOCA|nr:isochorismate synthase [Rhodococcus rhodnii LMG 5362]TXG92476.1 isochorismate synthase [Rhodococcus rhodnii]